MNTPEPAAKTVESSAKNGKKSLAWLHNILGQHKSEPDNDLRHALEDVIENYDEDTGVIAFHEKALIANILKLRNMTVLDVMIPRADIVALDMDTDKDDLFALLAEKQFSRLPVYRESLDDVIGTIHIKDILAELAQKKDFRIKDLVRQVPIVSPAMPALDLMLEMQKTTKHMAMVVDEYGGIDGLVTIGDLLESIVGEIDDEFQQDVQPGIVRHEDGSVTVDARYDLSEFEDEFGLLIDDKEGGDIDTLGGLVFNIAGRIPARGEVLTMDDSPLKFEIVDADPRRVSRLRIRNLQSLSQPAE